jgi:hypothetical protein
LAPVPLIEQQQEQQSRQQYEQEKDEERIEMQLLQKNENRNYYADVIPLN